MRSPFWIVNLGLLLLLVFSFAFITFSRVKIPKRASIEPDSIAPLKEKSIITDIKNIYEKDLFNTYEKELPRSKTAELVKPLPTPPPVQKITPPKIYEPEFLPPLNISLKGIIVVGTNDAKNRTIIQDNATNQEVTYKVGDTIQDAQLIRIFKNKIILLRVTGQQEILYLREQDAKLDPMYTLSDDWNAIIQRVAEFEYTINPALFTTRVKNLAQLIDLLNITTAYQKGDSIGLFVGTSASTPLSSALGLEARDLITTIHDMPVRTTQERLDVYKKIIGLAAGDTIMVNLKRKNETITLQYTLAEFQTVQTQQQKQSYPNNINSYNQHALTRQQHYAFTPTIDKIKKTDRAMMTKKSKLSMRSTL